MFPSHKFTTTARLIQLQLARFIVIHFQHDANRSRYQHGSPLGSRDTSAQLSFEEFISFPSPPLYVYRKRNSTQLHNSVQHGGILLHWRTVGGGANLNARIGVEIRTQDLRNAERKLLSSFNRIPVSMSRQFRITPPCQALSLPGQTEEAADVVSWQGTEVTRGTAGSRSRFPDPC